MNAFDINPAAGNTPLDPNELRGLIPNLATQAELNEFERQNILEATNWAFSGRVLLHNDPLTDDYLRELHRKMFDSVWKWAGSYRKTEKNLGVPIHEIRNRIPALLANAQFWRNNATYPADEIAIRVHHEMTVIHPFPNGNGRHARLLADVIAVKLGKPEFSWGAKNLVANGVARDTYIQSLRHADQGDLRALLAFARS